MCFFAVKGGTITVNVVFYHSNGLHGNYRSFTAAVKIPAGKPPGKALQISDPKTVYHYSY